MTKPKKSAAPVQTNAQSNMAQTLAGAGAATAVMDARPGAGPLPKDATPPPQPSFANQARKKDGTFAESAKAHREAVVAENNRLRAEAEKKADQALDKLFKEAGWEDEPTEAAEAEAPADSEAAPEAKTKTKDEQVERDPATEEALDKALKALRLDAWTTEDLATLSEAAIIRLGTQAGARQADVSKMIREASEKAKAAEAIAQTPQEPASQPVFDVKAAIKEAAEVLGEDTAPALEKLVEKVTGHSESRSSALEAQNKQLGLRLIQLEVSVAKSELSGQWPELAQEARYQGVLEKTAALWKSGDYPTLRDAMHDACMLKLGVPLKERGDASEVRKKREAGQPRDESSQSPPRVKTVGEYQDAVLDKLFAGDIEGARRVKRG